MVYIICTCRCLLCKALIRSYSNITLQVLTNIRLAPSKEMGMATKGWICILVVYCCINIQINLQHVARHLLSSIPSVLVTSQITDQKLKLCVPIVHFKSMVTLYDCEICCRLGCGYSYFR